MALFEFTEAHYNHLHGSLAGIMAQQQEILKELGRLKRLENTIMGVADDVKALVGKVTAENTVISGAVTLLNGLAAQVQALAAAGTPVDPADVKALGDAIAAGTWSLAAAVVADTPAAAPASAPQGQQSGAS